MNGLPRALRRSTSRRTLGLGLAAALLLTASVDGSATAAQAKERAKTFAVPGGGRIFAPVGSLSKGAWIEARRIRSTASWTRGHRRAVSLRVRHGRLRGPLRLTLPVDPGKVVAALPADLSVDLGFYDAKRRRWRTVPGRYDARRHVVTATIKHLSVWDVFPWASQFLGKFAKIRTDPPGCGGNIPKWFDPAVGALSDAPLLTCAEGWEDGRRATVKVINNRPYGMILSFGTPVDDVSHTQPQDLAVRLGAAIGDAVTGPNELYLPPLTERFVVFRPSSQPRFGVFQAAWSRRTLTGDLVTAVTEQVIDAIDVLVREEMVDDIVAACSWLLKPKVDNGSWEWNLNPLRNISDSAECALKGMEKRALHGMKDDPRKETERRLRALSRVALAGEAAWRASDYFFGQRDELKASSSFSVSLGPASGQASGGTPSASATPVGGTSTGSTPTPAGPGTTPAPPSSGGGSPPPPATYAYNVYGTCADGACGLKLRAGPGYSSYAQIGLLHDGDGIAVVCQARGERVGPSPVTGNSSGIWDRLDNGGWVSDLYVTTPNVDAFSPPIPQC